MSTTADELQLTSAEERHVGYVVVQLATELYAVPTLCIREIIRWRTPTVVPGVPNVFSGIISQRGVVLPVVDTRLLLGIAAVDVTRTTRYVSVCSADVNLALFVDAVVDLVMLVTDDFEPLPAGFDPQRARLLQALTRFDEHPLAVLDVPAIVAVLEAYGDGAR